VCLPLVCLPFVCLPLVRLITRHVTKSPRPSPSVFTYCKQSGNGLGDPQSCTVHTHHREEYKKRPCTPQRRPGLHPGTLNNLTVGYAIKSGNFVGKCLITGPLTQKMGLIQMCVHKFLTVYKMEGERFVYFRMLYTGMQHQKCESFGMQA